MSGGDWKNRSATGLSLSAIALIVVGVLVLCWLAGCTQDKPTPVPSSPPPSTPPITPPETVPQPPVEPQPVACNAVEVKRMRAMTLGMFDRLPRIIGGRPASTADYPFMVSIQYGGRHYCGGTLIDATHVLTAAHCEVAPGDMVLAGRDVLSGVGGQYRTVIKSIRHKDYDKTTNHNDIALLTLNAPLLLTPAQLGDAPQTGTAVAVGWGVTREGSATVSDELMQVAVPITGNAQCNTMYNGGIYDSMICADGGGIGACQGDSGGPLLVSGKQVGITSFGIGCARPEYPGVYTRVADYRQWLDSCQ